mmetsp:Transcript_267/g.815  ORF Transcript_267/g.815 Transcript_267/m.815 type:complete len:204 (+) Transcript_267:8216-8827(+)
MERLRSVGRELTAGQSLMTAHMMDSSLAREPEPDLTRASTRAQKGTFMRSCACCFRSDAKLVSASAATSGEGAPSLESSSATAASRAMPAASKSAVRHTSTAAACSALADSERTRSPAEGRGALGASAAGSAKATRTVVAGSKASDQRMFRPMGASLTAFSWDTFMRDTASLTICVVMVARGIWQMRTKIEAVASTLSSEAMS